MRLVIVVVLASARVASADPAIGLHAGGGISPYRHEASETSSLIAGGALSLERADRWWTPRFALDVRRIDGANELGVGDHTVARDIRGLGVRSLAGIRVQTHSSIQMFGQLSVGLEWQRASWKEFLLGPGPEMFTGASHHSAMSGVFEPALGVAVRSGHTTAGVQAALAIQSTTSTPTAVNADTKTPMDVLLTVFVEARR